MIDGEIMQGDGNLLANSIEEKLHGEFLFACDFFTMCK